MDRGARDVIPTRRLPLPTIHDSSAAEEHEPNHAEDQHRQPGGDGKQREHRRSGLGLARLGRRFDDPIALALSRCCHGALDPSVSSPRHIRPVATRNR